MFFLQIRTRDVLDAAPWVVRVQLWCLAVLGLLIVASVRVYARAGGGMADVPITSWWPFVLAVLSWIFSLGVWWAQVSALKDRVTAVEATAVRKDTLNDKLETLAVQIEAVRQLLERSDREWRGSLHGSKE